ncbi:MAG: hypothetical protein SFU98_13530, partial [Leptospiraceae bacterium]|nr:hypothetical protein [Leptospiraceae bacterium]
MKSRKIYYFVLLLLLNCFVGSERDKCELEIINEGIGSGSVASCAFAYSIIESGEETIRNANTNQDQRDGSLGSNAGRFL